MTLGEAIVSALILAISVRFSLQGWSHISSAAIDAAQRRQQLQQLELLLLSGRRTLQGSAAAALLIKNDGRCRFDQPALISALQSSLPHDPELVVRISPDSDAQGIRLAVHHLEEPALKRQLLLTPAGLGLCSQAEQP